MRLCVFCGSAPGNQPEYLAAAQQLGTALAKAGIGLVYGGAQVGLMGAVADAALAAGGEVIGVIPRHLVERELAHEGLTTLHEVGSMHERKAMMADLSDGFIALPGGVGTFEELFEVWTWGQLGHHQGQRGQRQGQRPCPRNRSPTQTTLSTPPGPLKLRLFGEK